jgi:hypothetical protein
MLRILFEMWPNCPLETLAGDSLYDGDEAFSFELVFDWGIQPVFVQHGKWSRKLDHHGTNGVPRCPCGAMKRKDTDNFYTAARRQREGIQRGERAPRLDARIRWVCPNGLPTHRGTTTRPADNARLYTFYPRGGEHELAYQRAAMLLRRNAVESVFSSLGEMGLAGKDHERPGWAGDVEVAWLLSCGFLYLTARRLAHETGAYEAARREAEELGLLEQPLLVNPAPGPSEFELARVRHDRRAAVGEERAPESWPADATEEPPGLGELEVA